MSSSSAPALQRQITRLASSAPALQRQSSLIRIPSSSAMQRRMKIRSAPKQKVNPSTLPHNVLKQVASSLHPADLVALRQTSSAFRAAVNRHPTKQNLLNSMVFPRFTSKNNEIMRTSGRRYMKHDQARKYLEKMFTHTGSGNIFRAGTFGQKPFVFPGMYSAVPTDHQRLALARAITGDHSKEGIEFMYKLIRKIRSLKTRAWWHGDRAVHAISPRSLASMHTKKGPGRKSVVY